IVFDDSWTQLPGWMSKPTAPHESEPANHQPIQVDDQPDLPQSSKEAAPTSSNQEHDKLSEDGYRSNPEYPCIPSPAVCGDYGITEFAFLRPHQIEALLNRCHDPVPASPITVEPAVLFHFYTGLVKDFIAYSNRSPSPNDFDCMERICLFQAWAD
ncbi:hypothetical protein PTTG_09407, partial [Puccinia triticina 1-1 BBBD Race 1]